MMIEVLGTGCAKCNKLETMVRAAADNLGVSYEIAHIHDINAIVQRGVMTTPALAIDGRVIVSGRLPSEKELTSWLTSAIG
jgi:small redox-active disulfide protein 2